MPDNHHHVDNPSQARPDWPQRIQRLEDIEAIRQLKAAYLHHCDRKNVDAIGQCFTAQDVLIDYGALGVFTRREDFLALYQQLACHDHIIDMHHGQNGQIQWHSPQQASATWDLYFHQINTEANTLTQLAGYYQDQYIKQTDGWRIQHTVFRATSTCVVQMDDSRLQLLFAGIQAPAV
ncbi:MAG: nuclear transport factor 2 family protein [Pseudomonadota bacterium]|nr:nuclear transport factor 2 family protein [Pseudomonadota bacterium]